MTQDHPLLTNILAGVTATGTHVHHWGELRREAFPGLTAWVGLKAWCSAHAIDCEMTYGQSSKASQVQFRRMKKAAAPAAAAPTTA